MTILIKSRPQHIVGTFEEARIHNFLQLSKVWRIESNGEILTLIGERASQHDQGPSQAPHVRICKRGSKIPYFNSRAGLLRSFPGRYFKVDILDGGSLIVPSPVDLYDILDSGFRFGPRTNYCLPPKPQSCKPAKPFLADLSSTAGRNRIFHFSGTTENQKTVSDVFSGHSLANVGHNNGSTEFTDILQFYFAADCISVVGVSRQLYDSQVRMGDELLAKAR
ncbi:hypothetical protein GCM10010331_64630 [Streptomyces xanthochromogenes]|nr:hypothetical protein GCM10010331_64630 [Streptomyces xanthochromogenes]